MSQNMNPYVELYSLLVEVEQPPRDMANFVSGAVLVEVLSKIKEFPLTKIQQNPTTFAHLFSNMKEIYKKIEEFWGQNLDK